MTDPIYIQVDDELREATPEEAAEIRQMQAESAAIYGIDETSSPD